MFGKPFWGRFSNLGPGSSGPSPYVAKAVHFDGATSLSAADMFGVTNSHTGVISFWTKIAASTVPLGLQAGPLQGANDINYVGTIGAVAQGIGFFQDLDSEDFANQFGPLTANGAIAADTWTHCLASWNTNFDAGSRLFAIYLNGILTNYTVTPDTGVAFDAAYESDGFWSVGGNSGDGLHQCLCGDLSELYFSPTASIIQPDNTINLSDIRRFITAGGKPVDPGSDAANFYGLGPCPIFMSGDALTFGSNLAGAGSFTIAHPSTTRTGSLTEGNPIIGIDNYAGMYPGLPLAGDGIQDDTVILIVDGGNSQLMLSVAPTLTQDSALTFGGPLTNASSSPSD